MSSFSRRSLEALHSCDDRLIRVANAAIGGHIDFAIIQGHRSKEEQARLVREGKSKTLESKHTHSPSLAFDFAPYIAGIGLLTGHDDNLAGLCTRYHIKPEEAKAFVREQYTLVAGLLIGAGQALGVKLRWGGDWDCDGDLIENIFDDLGHVELA